MTNPSTTTAVKKDLDCREHIETFVDQFYSRILLDPSLAPIFLDVAALDLDTHLPHIKNYWCKLLLGEQRYRRHTMEIHRQLNSKRPLLAQDFQRWLSTFVGTVDDHFYGERAQRAKVIASTIAENMARSLRTPPQD